MRSHKATKEIAGAVERSLENFFLDLPSNWCGKEHDAVSRFAFGHLLKECRSKSALHCPNQIGIEIPVGTPVGCSREKKGSWKDLVIWPQPGMTAFIAAFEHTHVPTAVIEWKVSFPKGRSTSALGKEIARDHEWLNAFTKANPLTVGYSVFLRLKKSRALEATRFGLGKSCVTIWET